jgi:hypothetical protein
MSKGMTLGEETAAANCNGGAVSLTIYEVHERKSESMFTRYTRTAPILINSGDMSS